MLLKIVADMEHEDYVKLRVLTKALFIEQETTSVDFETVLLLTFGFCILYMLQFTLIPDFV